MNHFVTEMCTFLLQNGALWNICLMHCGICEMGIFKKTHFKISMAKCLPFFPRPQCFITGILHIYIYILMLFVWNVCKWLKTPIYSFSLVANSKNPQTAKIQPPEFYGQTSGILLCMYRAVCKLVWLIEAEWRIYALVNLPSLVQTKSAPGHYLNQCWNFVKNKLQSDLNWNLYILIQGNVFENVVWEM